MSTKELNKFESFSDAFTYAIERRGKRYSYYYKKIGMDKGQFSKYIGENGIKNPQPPTREKLTNVVGIEINKKGNRWVLKDPLDAQSLENLEKELKNRVESEGFDFDVSGTVKDRLLLNLLDDAESLVTKLRRLIELEHG